MGLAGRSKVLAFGWMKFWVGGTPVKELCGMQVQSVAGRPGGLNVPTGNKASRRCGKCVGRGREQA